MHYKIKHIEQSSPLNQYIPKLHEYIYIYMHIHIAKEIISNKAVP